MHIGPPKTQIDDVQSWKTLFSTLLAQFLSNHDNEDLGVKINDSTIEIYSTSLGLLLTLTGILKDPTSIRQGLNYTIHADIMDSKENHVINREFDFSSLDAGILKEIFSKELLNTCGLFHLEKEDDHKNILTIRIKIENLAGFRKIWQGRLDILSSAVAGAGLFGLRKVLLKEDNPIGINRSGQKVELCEAIKTIMGIRKISEHSDDEEFFFNYGELLKLAFPCPPEIQTPICEEGQWTIVFDKFKLLMYLNQIFTEGFILHIKDKIATPICLAPINIVRMNNLFALALDCSASMKKQFSEYMINVKALITEIVKNGRRGDVISITKFNTNTESFKFELTGNIEQDTNYIFEKLNKFVAKGKTRLRGTIVEALSVILSDYQGFNKSLTIFSDGNETVNDVDESTLCDKMNELNLNRNYETPKIYSLGLGNEYQREFFEKWAINTGAKHFYLGDDINGFTKLLQYLKEMEHPRQLFHFMQDVGKIVSVFEGSVHHESSLELKENETFTCNDQEYQFVLKDCQQDELPFISGQTLTYVPGFPHRASENAIVTSDPQNQTSHSNLRCLLF